MAVWKGSPNYSTVRSKVDRIYIHWIVGNLATADNVFSSPASQVSAHYGVENGTVHQYVNEAHTAWHAGTGSENQRSIGIEHSAAPGRDASSQTLETSAQLIAEICKRHNIPCDRNHIKKHSENIATQCPGTIPIDYLVQRANQILKGGKDMIEDNQRHYDIINREWINSTGREFTWKEFRANFVGRDKLEALLTIHSSPETKAWQELAKLGKKAKAEKWAKSSTPSKGTTLKPGTYIVK